MRLTRHTDYALRVLLYAATYPDRRVSTEEISKAYGISTHHLVKVVNNLGRAGFLDLKRGRNGGIRLGRAPEEIVVGAVVRVTEPDLHLVECFDAKRNTCPIVPACRLIQPLADARKALNGTGRAAARGVYGSGEDDEVSSSSGFDPFKPSV